MFFLWYINDETGTKNLLIPRKKANYFDHTALYSERGSLSVMKFKASQFQLHLLLHILDFALYFSMEFSIHKDFQSIVRE